MHRIAMVTSVLVLASLASFSTGHAFEIGTQSPPHLAQGLHFPPAWYGAWEITEEFKDCQTEETLYTYTESDTICSNSTVDFDNTVEGFGECTGSIDDTSIDVQCSGSYEFFPGCTATITLTFQVTRTGNSFSGRETLLISLEGACEGAEDYCEIRDLSGTRSSGGEICPSVSAQDGSWSLMKQLYRR